ncbi:MAG TPA: hypothetical protein DCE41_15690 [Cytophagales bacterium]|nr:hypothetical protein [Cytophagales bacterium]HAA24127.1 hypothetical protein [Cytophagales bacterium]HAP58729.1 hypothetical protein [Cytophagales bacterium]
MENEELLPPDSLTPKEVNALIQFDATASGQPTDAYYAFLFAMYTGLSLKDLEQLNADQHLAMTEQGLILQFGTRTVMLDEVADGAPGTICDLYNGVYGQPFFGPIPPRIFPVKLKALFKEIGVTRKLNLNEGFAQRTGVAYYQDLGLDIEEIKAWTGETLTTPEPEVA